MMTKVREDYLKAIYRLEIATGVAKTTHLAKALSVSAATVSEMMRRMSDERPRLIAYKSHYGVRLTQKGKRAALDVIRRHRLLETFLHQVLGLSWDEVHEEAEVLEHHLSARVTEAIDQILDHPQFDPHGEPIPDRSGTMPARDDLALTDVGKGQRFRVTGVMPVSSELLQYLDGLGIAIGTTGVMISKTPLEGPIVVGIGPHGADTRHSLGRTVTARIRVAVTPGRREKRYRKNF